MRIACLLDTDFEDSEFRKPYDAFKAAGHEVVIIGLQRDAKLTGKQGKEVVRAERGIDEAKPDDFDALFLPGGYSPDRLRADQRMVDFARAFFDRERPVFAVCHGPQMLRARDGRDTTSGLERDPPQFARATLSREDV